MIVSSHEDPASPSKPGQGPTVAGKPQDSAPTGALSVSGPAGRKGKPLACEISQLHSGKQ